MIASLYLEVSLLCVVIFLPYLWGYRQYQQRIPNGDRIPHPCRAGGVWLGVGHQSAKGAGHRNSFGKDFLTHGVVWTEALCRADSDGDGWTNGEEIGDPNCHWKPGDTPDVTDINMLSHPGICTPLDSSVCQEQMENFRWLERECQGSIFSCPAMEEEGVMHKEIRLTKSRVPGKTTTYMCMDQIIESDVPLHMVGTTPLIGESNVVHHMLLFGCMDEPRAYYLRPQGEPYECGMLPSCQGNIISMWTFGMEGDCSYSNVGVRLGHTGYRRLALQVHWNNRFQHEHYEDTSGMTIYFTKRLRDYDAGVWVIGSVYLNIPPRTSSYITQATCAPECTRSYMKGPVYITGLLNHMHYLGQSMKVEVLRQGKRQLIAEDVLYNYDNPHFHAFKEPFEVLPGDELLTTCEFNSIGTNRTTVWGESTSDEMCFAFVTYYPEQNVRESLCYSWEMVPRCYTELEIPYEDCDFVEVLKRGTGGWLGNVLRRLKQNCRVRRCRKSCLPVIQELKTNPCLQGQIYTFLRINMGEDMDVFHALYSSCDEHFVRTIESNTSKKAVISATEVISKSSYFCNLHTVNIICLILVFMQRFVY